MSSHFRLGASSRPSERHPPASRGRCLVCEVSPGGYSPRKAPHRRCQLNERVRRRFAKPRWVYPARAAQIRVTARSAKFADRASGRNVKARQWSAVRHCRCCHSRRSRVSSTRPTPVATMSAANVGAHGSLPVGGSTPTGRSVVVGAAVVGAAVVDTTRTVRDRLARCEDRCQCWPGQRGGATCQVAHEIDGEQAPLRHIKRTGAVNRLVATPVNGDDLKEAVIDC